MAVCQGCGAELVTKSARIYCSNACQQATRQARLLLRWLETGAGSATSSADHFIRRHIREEQGGCCAICRMPSEWNGLPLVLVLDHVDGDADNNRRENLRLVCPNCDSQLPTYKARNKGRGRAWRRGRYANGQSY